MSLATTRIRKIVEGNSLNIFTLYISLLGLVIFILNLIAQVKVAQPYMDEEFHYKQSNNYCVGKWDVWDTKISTPPGLYYFTFIFQLASKYLFKSIQLLGVEISNISIDRTSSNEEGCFGSLFMMRISQIIFLPILLFCYYFIFLFVF